MPMRARASTNDRHASGAAAPNACIRATTDHDRFRSGDRSPRSPRTANALGYPSGGVFLFAFAKELHERARISASRTASHTHFSAPQHPARTPGHRGPGSGRRCRGCPPEARKRCAAMLGAGGGGDCVCTRIAGCSQPAMRSIHRTFPAVWVSRPSGARGCAVAYARNDARVFLDDGSSVGRATNSTFVGRRFDSGTSLTG